jgi:mRNA-degrading endonuclease toxin of MazEF toxin-antitoxin module
MFWPENFAKRSQDLPEAYQDAAQFYWRRVGRKAKDVAFGSESIPIILPRYLVQDIDTLEDFKRAEIAYKILHQDRFDEWNQLKKLLHNKKEIIKFKESEIYFLSVGENIGFETYGKSELFLRPVLIYKKLNKQTFVGIPLTSQKKEGSYYFNFSYKQGKISTAMFHQMRVFDIKRSEYYSGKISKRTMKNLKEKLKEFMNFTSSKEEEDRPTRAK